MVSFDFLHLLSALLQFLFSFFVSSFLHGSVCFILIVFVKRGATESSVVLRFLLKLSTIKSQGAGKISAGVLCKI